MTVYSKIRMKKMNSEQEQPGAPASSSFVGRTAELAKLQYSLRCALDGNGRIDVVVGDPGIGKTRIVEEISNRAAESGALGLTGRCYEEKGTPPYWAWTQVLNQCIAAFGVEKCRVFAGADSELCGRLDPRFKDPTSQASANLVGPAYPAESEAFNLFNGVNNFLAAASAERPLFIHLDDLHWADRETLQLLVFLTRLISLSRIHIVGTYRDIELDRMHPLSDTLADLSRERSFTRIPIGGLSVEEVRDFISASLGDEIAQKHAEALHELTNGNPLFLDQLVNYAGERGSRGKNMDPFSALMQGRLPEGIREIIGRRLNRLSADCNRMLSIAALAGHEFSFQLIARLLDDWEADQVLEAVAVAVKASILIEIVSGRADYSFCHPLVRETLVGELSIARRVKLHARIATSLEELHSAQTAEYASRIFYHAQQAEAILGGLKVAEIAASAAEHAGQTEAADAAVQHISGGYEALADVPMAERKAELLQRLAKCYFSVSFGLGTRGERMLHELYDYYESVGDIKNIEGLFLFNGIHFSVAAQQIAHRSLSVLPEGSVGLALAYATNGAWLLNEKRAEEAQTSFQTAVKIAKNLHDISLESKVQNIWAYTSHFAGDYQTSLKCAERALELSLVAGNVQDEILARYSIMDGRNRLGPPDEADRQLEILLQRLREVRDIGMGQYLEYLGRMDRPTRNGEWELARRAYERFSRQPAQTRLMVAYLGSLLQIELYTGNGDKAAQLAEQTAQTLPAVSGSAIIMLTYGVRPLASYMNLTEDVSFAADFYDACRLLLDSPESNARLKAIAHGALGLMFATKSDREHVLYHYEKLEPELADDGWDQAGIMAHYLGDYNDAIKCFRLALQNLRGSRPVATAWSRYYLGRALLVRNGDKDAEEARDLLMKSHETAERLEMVLLIEKIEELPGWRLQEGTSIVEVSDLARLLTEREIDVLKLISKGMTDKEIAFELNISIKTVSNHVGNIFRKTETGNRTEAARYALSRGIESLTQ